MAISGSALADDIREHTVDADDAENECHDREQRGEKGGESRRTDGLCDRVFTVWMSDIGTVGSTLAITCRQGPRQRRGIARCVHRKAGEGFRILRHRRVDLGKILPRQVLPA